MVPRDGLARSVSAAVNKAQHHPELLAVAHGATTPPVTARRKGRAVPGQVAAAVAEHGAVTAEMAAPWTATATFGV